MSEDIRKMIDKVKNIKQIINEVNLSSYSISTEKIKNKLLYLYHE
jgi:hypothetical protein